MQQHPADRKTHYLAPGVGHYGVFNGSRFRAEIAPRIADFILSHNGAPAAREKKRQPRRGEVARPNGYSLWHYLAG